jgi:peptide deformylase
MAILNILTFPNTRLRRQSEPVALVDDEVRHIVADMFETMYAAPGIGLAAPQVDIHRQIVVIDIADQNNQPLCLINPKILELSGEQQMDEGCLSVPGFHEQVTRAATVRVSALDQAGQPFTLDAEGLLAVCIQHELDHLQGKLFVDHLSSLKRQRIRHKLERHHRSDKPAEQPKQRAL